MNKQATKREVREYINSYGYSVSYSGTLKIMFIKGKDKQGVTKQTVADSANGKFNPPFKIVHGTKPIEG